MGSQIIVQLDSFTGVCSILDQFVREQFLRGQFTDCVLVSAPHSDTSTESECEQHCHSIVLSAHSTYLQRCLLKTDRNCGHRPHPTICLDVRPKILQFVVQLLYLGQIEVPEKDLGALKNALFKLNIAHHHQPSAAALPTQLDLVNHLKRRLTENSSDDLDSSLAHFGNSSLDDIDRTQEHDEFESPTVFTCQHCQKSYQYEISLKKHMKKCEQQNQQTATFG